MSVREQMGYALRCDFPGCDVETRDLGDFGFWGDIGAACDEWTDHDGYTGELGDYCAEHTVWEEIDEDGDEERVPMPYTLANLFLLAERRIARRIEAAERRALMAHGNRCRDMAARQARRTRVIETAWMREGGIRRELALRLAEHP